MAELENKKVAVIATHGFEDSELTSPVDAVKAAGAQVSIIAPDASQPIEGKKGTSVPVDLSSADAKAADFDALILPGGTANADKIRMDEPAVEFVRELVNAGKPVGVICHGGWILTDADVIRGTTMTSYPSLKTDLRNAGATWVDEEVHVDKRIVSSRTPEDLPAFNKAIVEEFAG